MVLDPQPYAEDVTVNLTFRAGAGQDPQDLPGLAHLFEHLAFQGTVSSPELLLDVVFREGGRGNGSTGLESTDYYVTLPPEKLPSALFLVSETLGWLEPALDDQKLRDELGIVHNELRQRNENNGEGAFVAGMLPKVFPAGHPYARHGIGTHESLDRITLDDVRAFFRTWYVPSAAVLVVTGRFDPRVAKREVRRYFADIPSGTAPDGTVPDGPLTADVRWDLARDDLTPGVRIVYQVPDDPVLLERLRLLGTGVLGNAPGQRPWTRLVEGGQASSFVTTLWTLRGTSLWIVDATLAGDTPPEALLEAIDGLVAEVAGPAPPTDEELAIGRALLEGFAVRQRGDTVAWARALQERVLRTGDPWWDRSAVHRAATPEALAEALRTVITGHRLVVVVGPTGAAP